MENSTSSIKSIKQFCMILGYSVLIGLNVLNIDAGIKELNNLLKK